MAGQEFFGARPRFRVVGVRPANFLLRLQLEAKLSLLYPCGVGGIGTHHTLQVE